MLDILIEKTNKEEFYSTCDLLLERYTYNAKTKICEIIFSVNQISSDEFVEYEEWKITCIGTERIRRFDYEFMMPYIKMRLLEKHPLLWLYHEDQLECEIKGAPNNINALTFDLLKLLEKEAGNWIKPADIFMVIKESMFKLGKRLSIPSSLEKGIRQICIDQNLEFKITNYEVGEDKGYADRPNTKILILGNEDVSPYDFDLGQPYIIAGGFTAERTK